MPKKISKAFALGLACILLAAPALNTQVRAAEPRKPGEYPPTADSIRKQAWPRAS